MSAAVELIAFLRVIASDDPSRVSALLVRAPELARARLEAGATRQAADAYFLGEIDHHVYAGDTALHVAAAAYNVLVISDLVDAGAPIGATNRRGAQPLHYAVDGTPGSAHWDPVAQRDTVACLVESGADVNAVDANGTTPLHRAVRNRCAAAVKVLLDAGADPHATNGRGSTAIQLAGWTTGRGGSGWRVARAEQEQILRLLGASGSTPAGSCSCFDHTPR